MTTVTEPGPPGPEPLRVKEIKNRSCILKPTLRGKAESSREGGGDWNFVECEVWLLDRSGVERHESEVRISWKRAFPSLKASSASTSCAGRRNLITAAWSSSASRVKPAKSPSVSSTS